MRRTFTFLALILFTGAFAQPEYESGYYISNDGVRHPANIKFKDWSYNPKQFTIVVANESKEQSISVSEAAEFGVIGKARYVRYIGNVDQSSEKAESLSDDREPINIVDTIFIKALVEGPASLFVYSNQYFTRYFYSLNGSSIQQLVYKQYLDGNAVKQNETFKQQLWPLFNGGTTTAQTVNRLKYRKSDLVQFFVNHNKGLKADFLDRTSTESKAYAEISIRPGFGIGNFTATEIFVGNTTHKFKSAPYFRVGAELDFVLPVRNNLWSVVVEPTFQSFKSDYQDGNTLQTINYSCLEVPMGVRRKFPIGKQSKMFINAQYVLSMKTSSYMLFDNTKFRLDYADNFAFGLGLQKGKWSAEFRYNFDRNPLNKYTGTWSSRYTNTALILGYRLY